ncbi:MAG: DNA alkylation repair protein [Eubacteriales bacterium]|nr:DNA alkylation repair protein [Eubacteriales bacterium]MDD4583361.1 DNA alkylation repair protein [Eubacteriales bacterium]
MEFKELFNNMQNNGDKDKAIKMSSYMRNKFPFLGIYTQKRRALCKDFFTELKKNQQIDRNFVNVCWEQQHREFQYIAVDYLSLMQKILVPADVKEIKKLILSKSWWDTVDGLDSIIGSIALTYPEVNETLLIWSMDDNIWLRRVAIDHQLSRKEKTNIQLLETIIKNNFGQTEFFINKAIGWSLRDYSKTDPDWVRDFINRYHDKLAPLSIKEGSKYL